jgi:hypothetical protein
LTLKVRYQSHKRPPMILILNQMNPFHILKHISLPTILILSSHQHLFLYWSAFLWGFRLKFYIYFHVTICTIYPHPNCSPSFDHPRIPYWTIRSTKLLSIQFPPASGYLLFRDKYEYYFHRRVLKHPRHIISQDERWPTKKIHSGPQGDSFPAGLLHGTIIVWVYNGYRRVFTKS